jgi:peptide/nickel transport system substrate-binding protein
MGAEIDTLDPHLSANGYAMKMMEWIGGNLVTVDPSGKIVPYLAESWTVSPDGTTYDFTVRKDVKFHDGTALKASDFVYTFKRMMDPETKAVQSFAVGDVLDGITLVDDYTFEVKFKVPQPTLLEGVAFSMGVYQPMSEAYVKSLDGPYGRKPMSVGPYKFSEWQTGNLIVLKRNPDYTWAPAFAHQGPAYIDTIEVRFLPEVATITAGLENGEIDFAGVGPVDLPKFQDKTKYTILERLSTGILPYIAMNLDKPPLDDIRVRKALNLALDRQTIIKVVALGAGVEQRGPLTPSTVGYWPDSEKIGLGFDLAQAKALLREAGYTEGANGMFEKDGQPLKFTLNMMAGQKLAEVLQEQWKAAGIQVDIQQQEAGVLIGALFTGGFELSWAGWAWPTAEILDSMFNSKMIGAGANVHRVRDEQLDTILNATEVELDQAKRMANYAQVQQRVIEQAYIIPLYASKTFLGLNARFKGVLKMPYDPVGFPYINEMYLAK